MENNNINLNESLIPYNYTYLQEVIFNDLLDEDFDGLGYDPERVRLSGAGATTFELPGDNPSQPDSVKTFTGVILHCQPLQSYYKEKYTGAKMSPDCISYDCKVGAGIPGGDCESCQYNQFGSGENKSKACKLKYLLFILREGEILPIILSVPTGSVPIFKSYRTRIITKLQKLYGVVTRFSFGKANNGGGIAYSQIQFAIERQLSTEELVSIKQYAEQVKEYSKQLRFDNSFGEADYEIDVNLAK